MEKEAKATDTSVKCNNKKSMMLKPKTSHVGSKVNVAFVRDNEVGTFINDVSLSNTRSRTRCLVKCEDTNIPTLYYKKKGHGTIRHLLRCKDTGIMNSSCQLEDEEQINNKNFEDMEGECDGREAE